MFAGGDSVFTLLDDLFYAVFLGELLDALPEDFGVFGYVLGGFVEGEGDLGEVGPAETVA